jgi:hypothetical protein
VVTLIHNLSSEFELIQDDRLREFAVEAISRVPEECGGERVANYIKKVVYYLEEFCEVADADDVVRDMMIVAGLIHSLEFEPVHVHLKPQSLRIYLYDLIPVIGRDTFDNIMFLVSRQMGFQTVYPELTPKIDDPIHVWMLPLAIHLAKKDVN